MLYIKTRLSTPVTFDVELRWRSRLVLSIDAGAMEVSAEVADIPNVDVAQDFDEVH